MVFGRKAIGGPPTPPQDQHPLDGRGWVDANLARYDQPGSTEFAQALGHKLFDSSYQALKNDRGVRIEAIVGMLASVGGFLCLTAVLNGLRSKGQQPSDIGMVTMRGHDGNIYHFGDASNRLLCEANLSLISLVFGAAQQHGAAVSVEMLHEEMARVARTAGTAQFLELGLPPGNAVDSPLEWIRHFTRFVVETTATHFREAVASFPLGVPPNSQAPEFLVPRIVGFALQQAIDVGHNTLDPLMLARIALVCAVRAAKIDPERVLAG